MLFSTSLLKLRDLQSLSRESTDYDHESAKCRVISIILKTTQCRFVRPVHRDLLSSDTHTHFIKLNFVNKGIQSVNFPSVLRSKSAIGTVATYLKKKSIQLFNTPTQRPLSVRLSTFH